MKYPMLVAILVAAAGLAVPLEPSPSPQAPLRLDEACGQALVCMTSQNYLCSHWTGNRKDAQCVYGCEDIVM